MSTPLTKIKLIEMSLYGFNLPNILALKIGIQMDFIFCVYLYIYIYIYIVYVILFFYSFNKYEIKFG